MLALTHNRSGRALKQKLAQRPAKAKGRTLCGLLGYPALYAEARNLADRNYVSLFSVQDRAESNAAILTPGEPRSVYVGARFKF